MLQISAFIKLLYVIGTALPVASFSLFEGADPSSIHAVLVSAVAAEKHRWWVNYAAEAEVARTYHWLLEHGVLAENIILFMNGNFSHDSDNNPYPGSLYTDLDRRRNYAEGLKIDYKGDEVSINNYLAVLRGEANKVKGGSGRVLKSTNKNRVFVSHEGHGLFGQLVISEDGFLTLKDLNDALKEMGRKKMFKELVFFIMACQSGSMFEGQLDANGTIYAMTAAHPDKNTDGKDQLKVTLNGKSYDICINTEFGDAWMDFAERSNTQEVTLNEQYKFVQPQVASNPLQFGNLDIGQKPIAHFQGIHKGSAANSQHNLNNRISIGDGYITNKRPQANLKRPLLKPKPAPKVRSGVPISGIAEYLKLKKDLKQAQAKDAVRAQTSNLVSNKKNDIKSLIPGSPSILETIVSSITQVIQQKLDKLEKERSGLNNKIDSIISGFVEAVNTSRSSNGTAPTKTHLNALKKAPRKITQIDCHDKTMKAVWRFCKDIVKNPFVHEFTDPIVSLCEAKIPAHKIVEQIKQQCQK